MMTKNKKWFTALSVATIITANGVVMAAVTTEQQGIPGDKRSAFSTEKDFKHQRDHKANNTELLALLKIDAETFKSEMKAGKSLITIAKEHGVSEKRLKEFMVKQMTQRIEAGVKAGKLTADQAKKMKADSQKRVSEMMKGKVPMHRGHKPGAHNFDNSALLKLLKVDQETFRSEMKAGKSLITIAKEHSVSEQALKDFMVKQMTQRIEAGVKAGKLTADQAEKMKADSQKRVSELMKGKTPMHRGHKPGARNFDNSALLKLLKVDQETFRSEIKAGKSLVTIAKEHGVSEQALKDAMLGQMKQRIDDGVKAGKISADKAEKMKASMEQRIGNMINGKGPKSNR